MMRLSTPGERLRAAVATKSRRREPTLRLDAAHDNDVAGGDAAELGKAGDFEMTEVSKEDAEDEDELAQALRLSLKAEAPPPPAEKRGSELVRPTTAQAGHRAVADPAGRSAEGGSADHGGVTLDTEFHFVTECFFLALRALQVALVPATKRAEKILHDLARKSKAPPLHHPTAHAAAEALKQLQLAGLGQLQHCLLAYRVALEGEQLQALLLRFLSLAAAWLLHLDDGSEGAPPKFALLPEACVTGICELLIVTARNAPPRLAGHPAAAAIVSRFCCDWLGRRELLASPFVRYTMADVLSTLIEVDAISRHSGHGAMRLFDLVDAPAAERVQAPLMGLYVELGLHTNASAVTDKNGQRYNLMRVLRKLWEMPRAWQQLQSLAKASVAVSAGGGGGGGGGSDGGNADGGGGGG